MLSGQANTSRNKRNAANPNVVLQACRGTHIQLWTSQTKDPTSACSGLQMQNTPTDGTPHYPAKPQSQCHSSHRVRASTIRCQGQGASGSSGGSISRPSGTTVK